MQEPHDYRRAFLAVFLAAIVLIGWQALIEWPRRQALSRYATLEAQKRTVAQVARAEALPVKETEAEENASLTHEQRIAAAPRVTIHSDKLHGSINLKGARFDDISLAKYRVTQDVDSPEVTLFAPNGEADAYFAQIGWLSNDTTKVPDQKTVWTADRKQIGAGDSVKLQWNNGEGVTFFLTVSLDSDYMFRIAQQVNNQSGHAIAVTPYAYINRSYEEPKQNSNAILHEGPIGVLGGALKEVSYKELRDKGNKTFDNTVSGWFGITDKYWLSALIPTDPSYKTTFGYYNKNGQNRYQVDYMGAAQNVAAGTSADYDVRLFAGAKEVTLLDAYVAGDAGRHEPPIPLFDRAVDFGSLYFLTKPLFGLLNRFYTHLGNFGVAILALTIVVKLFMYPLASKSYRSTSQMRDLQPEITKLRERFGDDHMALQKETMALYKREKVNPAAGCLPLFIQLPVFFSLYKVLYVTIEMRHAPFFGWIKDLSAPDPSNIFTAFGLINWTPMPWMHIGILPICYCITMIVQMKQQPKPADPTQAKVMGYMPYFFLLIFAKMPAGLLVYWIWSNIISIVQQRVISSRHHAQKARSTKTGMVA